MIQFNEAFVDSAAPNAGAIANGKEIIRKGNLVTRNVDEEETILFGECRGSGSSNYQTSVDFLNGTDPVYRCTCPSRQIPCKHSLALMYAWVRKDAFAVKPVPEDVTAKREKAKDRAAQKKEKSDAPKKVDLKALAKKIDAQLEGLGILERMTHDLLRGGLGTMNAKSALQIEESAKQLGNAYLPGAQNALRSFTMLFHGDGGADAEKQREAVYTEALDRLTRLHMLCRRGRDYLNSRKADPGLKPDTTSTIAEWLGHAWQLGELKEHGLVQPNAELIQLSFSLVDDVARKEHVDCGAWLNLGTGAIQLTKNFRPYTAVRHIKEDDCFYQVRQVPELYVYPGDMNPRIRWNEAGGREVTAADYKAIRGHARPSLAEAIRAVKAQAKDPLADKNPYLLVAFRSIGKVGDQVILEDAAGERIALADNRSIEEFDTIHLLNIVEPALLRDQVMLIRMIPDLDSLTLKAKPLTIVGADSILRLAL